MRVFLSGATGFIGSTLVPELIKAGHEVLGMTRSDAGAKALVAAGAEVHRGTLEDPASLRDGAAKADGVIHTAFDHDFSNFVANCEKDRRAIEALGAVLKGSDRPLIITSGTGAGQAAHGEPATEDHFNPRHPNPRLASELAGAAMLAAGVNVQVMRLPQVHDPFKQGLITPAIAVAREKGVSAYVGDGRNRWPAAHVVDVARLYRLALEKGEAGARYHAVAEEGIPVRDIADVIGRGLKIPVVSLAPQDAAGHFGWLAGFAGMDIPASSELTRKRLGWQPTGPSMMADLEKMAWFSPTPTRPLRYRGTGRERPPGHHSRVGTVLRGEAPGPVRVNSGAFLRAGSHPLEAATRTARAGRPESSSRGRAP